MFFTSSGVCILKRGTLLLFWFWLECSTNSVQGWKASHWQHVCHTVGIRNSEGQTHIFNVLLLPGIYHSFIHWIVVLLLLRELQSNHLFIHWVHDRNLRILKWQWQTDRTRTRKNCWYINASCRGLKTGSSIRHRCQVCLLKMRCGGWVIVNICFLGIYLFHEWFLM
jgi:hypothetical protein